MNIWNTLRKDETTFASGYLTGLMAVHGCLINAQHGPGKLTLGDAAKLFMEWLDPYAGSVKNDFVDESPIFIISRALERLPLPPGVKRLPGVAHSDNEITDEMQDNRDAFLNQTDEEGDDSWRSRMDPRTEVDES